MKRGKNRIFADSIFVVSAILLITGITKIYIALNPLNSNVKFAVLCISAAVPLFIIHTICLRKIIRTSNKEQRNLKREISRLETKLHSEEQKLREERESTEAMLCKLQPEFIYDSLRSIANMCDRKACGNPKAADALSELEKYLYVSLDAVKKNEEHSFERELNHIITYIKLEEMRLGRKINVEFNCKETVFTIPMLSVQALVEGAVNRVIKDDEEKNISIATYREDYGVTVSVADNAKLQNNKDYLAKEIERLENVRKQLKRYNINLLYTTNSTETKAVIRIPKQ